MKSWQKIILITCCLLGMGISFLYHLFFNMGNIGETRAPVHVNIEIDKAYTQSVSIIATLNIGDRLFPLSAEVSDVLHNAVLYAEIKTENPAPPLIRKLFFSVPKETHYETLYAIDNINVFIGNKMFYFSHSDIVSLQGREQNDQILYELSGLEYTKSIVAALLKRSQWINWYGDFNLAVKAVSAFFIYPTRFLITWGFLVCFLILCRPAIENIYSAMRKQKQFLPELSLLGFIVLAGFILRLNGYVRHSSWLDELYSACQASNPNMPFLNTFGDPGNPPLYFILLRLWFTLFGWTEQSGRFLSVLIGSAAIISLYVMVKRFSNKKAAFLSVAYMAVSAYFIGFSQEMRPYILEVFLVSIAAFRFLIIIQKQEMNFIDLIWYIIPSVLLVNTHYYGSLFVFANFLFYFAYSIYTKTFTWKKTVVFFTGNIVIVISLLPYFIHTALRKALLNTDFNTWIPKPGLILIYIAALIPFSGIVYIYMRKTVLRKIITNSHCCFVDYSVFVAAIVYLIAFGVSLYRPILILKYLILLYPLLIAVVAVILINVFTNNSKLIGGLCIVFAFFWITTGYEAGRGGGADVYHESLAYISKDSEAHHQLISVENTIYPLLTGDRERFYGYKQLHLYVLNDNYNVLYLNPLHRSEEGMYSEIATLGISAEKVLRIRINKEKCVLKIYP